MWKLTMHWWYHYDKEGTWTDDENGVEEYDIAVGVKDAFPNFRDRFFEILSVNEADGTLMVHLSVDGARLTLTDNAPLYEGRLCKEYTVCGDHVSQDLYYKLQLTQV